MTIPRNLVFLLRLEGAAIAVACLLFFQTTGASWWLFAACLLLPDLLIIGYVRGPRFGALAYNAVHNYGLAVALGAGAWLLGGDLGIALAAILGAHIGLDRALGYGFKLPEGFTRTHLGPIGRAPG